MGETIDVFLQPGECFVGDERHRIRTLLGSCVSITLWHPGRRIGAMSHFMLAMRGARRGAQADGRYGDEALGLMLRELDRAGLPRAECQAKIFGGGNMFANYTRRSSMRIGQQNGAAARALLEASGIPIVSENLHGDGHRYVIFDVANGDVWVRHVRS